MTLQCGIVGLPNVGKSTLFNALTETAAAQAANFPFCTIEPNVGRVAVPDERLQKLAILNKSIKTVPTSLEFVDIAGLVKGASQGEGLGNQFLNHIREVDAIIHVVRCFEDANVTHVEGRIDPIADIEIIDTELMIADLENVEKRISGIEKRIKSTKDPELQMQYELLHQAKTLLDQGRPARQLQVALEAQRAWKMLQLITAKPVLYVCNVAETDVGKEENPFVQKVIERVKNENAKYVIISAAIEAEVAQLPSQEERGDFLTSLGLQETGLNRVIREAYSLLNLITFFTSGPKETHAWTLKKGKCAPQGAGEIHSDFERGFICAEVIGYSDYIQCEGEMGAKTAGKLRQEGKSYVVQDGDIILFRFNV